MDIIKLYGGGFPLTIERFNFLQNAPKKNISDLSKLAGTGNLIIEGLEITGSTISDGVVIIGGEVFPFKGGAKYDKIRIQENTVNVPYNEDADDDGNLDLKAADTIRTAICSEGETIVIGDGQNQSLTADEYLLSSFVRVGSLQKVAPPVGAVQMYYGDPADLPYFWQICDGSNGNPDLRDKFIAGAGGAYSLAQTGGAKEVTLSKSNLPNYSLSGSTGLAGGHSHAYDKSVAGRGYETRSDDNPHGQYTTASTSYAPSHSHTININSEGGDAPHENRPPFFALHYIIFKGF
jgi:microcystin-dependent protein